LHYSPVWVVLGSIATVIVASICPTSSASIQPRGDPIYGSSWGQCFDYTDPRDGTVDLVAVSILSGGPFEAPTFRKFDVPEWDVLVEYPTGSPELAAAGTYTNPVAALSFELWFESEPEDPVSLWFGAWRPGELLSFEGYTLSWAGGGQRCVWVAQPDPVPVERPQLIPAPGAALLCAVGLSLVGWVQRRLW